MPATATCWFLSSLIWGPGFCPSCCPAECGWVVNSTGSDVGCVTTARPASLSITSPASSFIAPPARSSTDWPVVLKTLLSVAAVDLSSFVIVSKFRNLISWSRLAGLDRGKLRPVASGILFLAVRTRPGRAGLSRLPATCRACSPSCCRARIKPRDFGKRCALLARSFKNQFGI